MLFFYEFHRVSFNNLLYFGGSMELIQSASFMKVQQLFKCNQVVNNNDFLNVCFVFCFFIDALNLL